MSSRAPARLSSGLLSRKGMAAPSAGHESRTNMVRGPQDAPRDAPRDAQAGEPDATEATNAESTRPQLRQGPAPARSTLADWAAPDPTAPAGAGARRIRVSLRLDEDRHTRLKLVATQRNCTLQSLFTEAIDEFFVRHAPDLQGISAHLRRGAAAIAGGNTARDKHSSEGRNGPSQSR